VIKVEIGKKAFDFCLSDKDKNKTCLKDFRGKWVILYFYPKDNTPGCSLEAVQFTRAKEDFEANNATILGVSPDSPESHCSFSDKKGLTLTLLSDSDHEVAKAFEVWKPKKMFGKEYFGIVRTTFLIDPKGTIAHIWPKVMVAGHAEDVLKTLKDISQKQ
jgi:peroxiredoxin Q/BCP